MIEGQPKPEGHAAGEGTEFSGLVIEGQPKLQIRRDQMLIEFSGLVIEGQPKPFFGRRTKRA